MASRSSQSDTSGTPHLDASGSRNVVYCHHCEQEWWRDEYGLECPFCEGNVTEIVTPGIDDPRRMSDPISQDLLPGPDRTRVGYTSNQEETNIDGSISNGPNNPSIIFHTSRTFNPPSSSESREASPRPLFPDFRNFISSFLGPQFQHSAPGRSGPDTLFSEPSIQTSTFRLSGNGSSRSFVGGRIIFTNGGSSFRPRNANESQSETPPRVDDIFTIISNIAPSMISEGASFGHSEENEHQTGPFGLQALFSAILDPRNARFGDAVYSQEALDQILNTFMEQNTTSNAPKPAPLEAIAALPRKKLDGKLLGNGAKGECSICMDEVKRGDEVLVLPCNHWFDEGCATAWLIQHNTCPICRKGITEESSSSNSPNSQRDQTNSEGSQNVNRSQRQASTRSIFSRESRARIEERLNSHRNFAGMRLTSERSQQRRFPRTQERDENLVQIPGSFPTDCEDHTESLSSERPRGPRRSSNTRNNGNLSRNSALNRFRGIHDRLNNNCRNS